MKLNRFSAELPNFAHSEKIDALKATNKKSLNRKIAPPIHQVTSLALPHPSVYRLDNGIPVYETRLGTQDILKLEIVFHCGRPDELKRLTSRATSRLLREGTASYSSVQIADTVDFYAGTLQTPINLDTSGIVLYCMTKHFESLLPIVAEMVQSPSFPEKELKLWVDNNIQRLTVDLTKNDVIAYRKITELIFGDQTAYGYSSQVEDYRNLTTDDLRAFFQRNYTADNATVFISGKTDAGIIALLNRYLGQNKTPKERVPGILGNGVAPNAPGKIKIPNKDTLQSAIRIGRPFGNRKQPDYNGFFVLNTILGGYFGSRLMKNVREDKGFTYNIYSSVELYHNDGYFYVSSEVGNEFVKSAVAEIYKEMALLQQELVDDDEMDMVRNYLLGNMLNMVDGPFAVGDLVRTFVTEGIPFEAFDAFVDTIKHISPQEIRDLAQRYFQPEDMFEVIVGE